MPHIVVNAQLGMFFDPIARPEDYLGRVNQALPGIFDRTPTILPIPNEESFKEVAVLQMPSSTRYVLNVARTRADFFLQGIGHQTVEHIDADFLRYSRTMFDLFSGERPYRIAAIYRIFFVRPHAEQDIATFLSINPLEAIGGTAMFDSLVRFTTTDTIDEKTINNYTLLEKTEATVSGEPNRLQGVQLTRDFNTLPTERYQWTTEAVERFIRATIGKRNLNVFSRLDA